MNSEAIEKMYKEQEYHLALTRAPNIPVASVLRDLLEGKEVGNRSRMRLEYLALALQRIEDGEDPKKALGIYSDRELSPAYQMEQVKRMAVAVGVGKLISEGLSELEATQEIEERSNGKISEFQAKRYYRERIGSFLTEQGLTLKPKKS